MRVCRCERETKQYLLNFKQKMTGSFSWVDSSRRQQMQIKMIAIQ